MLTEVFYLSVNLTHKKKIALLKGQLTQLNSIDFDPDRLEKLYHFENRTKKIFAVVFSDSDEYISKLNAISYSAPSIFDDDMFISPEHLYFYEGIKNATLLLKGAIEDIEFEEEISAEITPQVNIPQLDKSKVFIVHGHDDALKIEVALFVKRLGLEDIILHEQNNRGMTIIEKFEANSDVGFAIVLYTPCDVGRSVSSDNEKPRARQNVIFEHGYFVAKLGRENVVALNKGDVEVPNDLSGMIYTSYEKDDWKRQIAHELEESGYKIDYKSIR